MRLESCRLLLLCECRFQAEFHPNDLFADAVDHELISLLGDGDRVLP